MSFKYENILNSKRIYSEKHPPMPNSQRAAQFAPFAALTGYEACIDESSRFTENEICLCEDGEEMLNEKIAFLFEHENEHVEITITYFVPDIKKSGGAYITKTGIFYKINQANELIIFEDGEEISFSKVINIDI